MLVGGPKSVSEAVKAAGGQVGPRSKWLGAWCLKSGTGGWTEFFNECKAAGQQPLVFWWAWGDDISPAAIKNGVQDRYQNVFKTQANLLPILKTVMEKAKAVGVQPLVAIENEFNKNGCEKSPEFAAWFDASAAIVKANGGKVLFAPGAWGDLVALSVFYQPQVEASDMVGLQCGYFRPRRKDDLALVGDVMARQFAKLPTGKPRILYDTFLSTYGGNFSTTHPFAGGDGKALEAQQAKAILGLGKIPGLAAMVYRDVRDSTTFDVKNYGGYAERFVGTMRSDGTKKPGFDALMSISKPATPAPAPAPPPDPCADVKASLAAKEAALAASEEALAKATAERDALRVERDSLLSKVQAGRAALA